MASHQQDAYQEVFRALPQPGILCGLVRDAAGSVVDIEILDLTATGGEIIGRAPEAATGLRLVAFSGKEYVGPLMPLLDQVAATGERRDLVVPAPNGHTYAASMSRVGPDRVVILAHDITERLTAEEARHEAEERYRQAMAVVKDGIVIQDTDGRIVAANPVASEILGITLDELTGLTSMDARWHAESADGRPLDGVAHPAMQTLRTGHPSRDVVMSLDRADGRRIWLLITAEALRDGSGAISGVMASFTDVTEQMATGVELQQVQARYQTTLQQIRERDQALQQRTTELQVARDVARLGFWRTDLRTGVTVWSPELFAMGGLDAPPDGVVSPEGLAIAFPPAVAAERDRLVMRAITTGEPWELELHVARPDGNDAWILTRGTIERDLDGTPIAATGTAMDISGPKAAALALSASEHALRERNAELEEARRIAGLGTWRVDGRTDTTTWSPELMRMAGLDPEQPALRPSELDELTDPDVAAARAMMVYQSAQTGEPFEQEYQLHVMGTEDDPWFWIRGVGETDEHGQVIGASGIAMDITIRKRAELALRASEEALRHRTEELEEAREIAGVGVWRRDWVTGVTTWSPHLSRLFGIDPVGPPPSDVEQRTMFGEENIRLLRQAGERSARTGETVEAEMLVHRRDGEPRWINLRARADVDATGAILAVTGTMMDITERKIADIALRDSEEELRQRTAELEEAQRIARIGFWRVNMQTRAGFWSGELADTFGIRAEEIRTLDQINTFFGPEGAERLRQAAYESAATGRPWDLELPIIRPDGVQRWIQNRGVAEMGPEGPVAIHGTAMDITDRKMAELALQASEERFRTVLDGLVEGALILDPEWRIVYVNRGFTHQTGSDPAEDIGRSLLELVPHLAGSEILARFERCMRERASDRFEGSLERPDSPDEWWEFSVQPVPEGIFVLALDITARHLAESVVAERVQRERERSARLEEAGRMARLGIWRRDLLTRTTTWSPEMYDLFEVDPDGPPMAPELVDAMLSPETRALRDHVAATSIAAGVPWEVELEVRLPSGGSRWVLQHGTGETDATGALVAYRGTALDITERKRTEAGLRQFNESLERRVKERTAELEAANEELRSFSYTVSHDLRAPVRAVAGFARILERDHSAQLDERALHSLDNIKTAGEAMGRLIDDLLAYTRIGRSAVRHEPVDVGSIARRLAATFAPRVEERGGTIEVVEPIAVPLGDATLIEELLINLVDNALNYARPDVPPCVRIGAARDGDVVRLSVADNGVGIPPEMRERIFEVFTRLPGSGEDKGTGIGLAIVRKAARSMGSDVTVASVLGEGTTFSVDLPSATESTPD